MSDRIWILGAPDPEMAVIESVLREHGEWVEYATVDGRRVRPDEAYGPRVAIRDGVRGLDARAIVVECRPAVLFGSSVDGIDWAGPVDVVDHHHPGDPGSPPPRRAAVDPGSHLHVRRAH